MKEPFIDMYDRFFNHVYRYVYSKVGNKWDTDDVVSDVFRKAFERFSTLQEDSNAKAWLMTIARHTVIDFYRKKKDVVTGEVMEILAQSDSFEEKVEMEDDMECLQKAMSYLPEEDQELIKLKYFGELKYKEIVQVIGKTEEALKTRVFRLLKKVGILVKKCIEGVGTSG
ncbi:RNA polymerase sigma factor [Neobacillus sp. D3-1R]|uniref:RNA polymerase sigma factor n=1 Tax=Neobacillus sp. D3-1R TaxID=3445778 RepID=UPI003FA0CDDE